MFRYKWACEIAENPTNMGSFIEVLTTTFIVGKLGLWGGKPWGR
jgi:hypothetical protein